MRSLQGLGCPESAACAPPIVRSVRWRTLSRADHEIPCCRSRPAAGVRQRTERSGKPCHRVVRRLLPEGMAALNKSLRVSYEAAKRVPVEPGQSNLPLDGHSRTIAA